MKQTAFIFIGRSGCGKGTQVELLAKALEQKEPSIPTLVIETGKELREFIQGDKLTHVMTKEIYMNGLLAPEFISVQAWINRLIQNFNGNQHLIFDGTPRKPHEAGVLDSIFPFYGFERPFVLHIDISREEAMKRLSSRKRLDDSDEDVKKRLEWYESDVMPTIAYYVNNPAYRYLKIDGERSVEEIHRDIVEKLSMM